MCMCAKFRLYGLKSGYIWVKGVSWLFNMRKFVQYSGIVKQGVFCYLIYTIFGFILKYTLFRVSYGTGLRHIAADFQMLSLTN